MPVNVDILNYLGETQKELHILMVISKTTNEDYKQPRIEWELIFLN